MNQNTVDQILARIQAEADASSDDVRFVRTCAPGDEIRQGDIYLYPVEPMPLDPWDIRRLDTLQLAPGSTPGARHVIEGDAEAYELLQRMDPLEGPIVHASARVTLTHPEHADVSIPAGTYAVRYQRDWTHPRGEAERDVRRVLD